MSPGLENITSKEVLEVAVAENGPRSEVRCVAYISDIIINHCGEDIAIASAAMHLGEKCPTVSQRMSSSSTGDTRASPADCPHEALHTGRSVGAVRMHSALSGGVGSNVT